MTTTPGPWWVSGGAVVAGTEPQLTIQSTDGQVALIAAEDWEDNERIIADARLLSLAPDLYGALRELVNDLIDADEHANSETGVIYNSVKGAMDVLALLDGGGGLPIDGATDQEAFIKSLHERLFPEEPLENVRMMFDEWPTALQRSRKIAEGAYDFLYRDRFGGLRQSTNNWGAFAKTPSGMWYANEGDYWYPLGSDDPNADMLEQSLLRPCQLWTSRRLFDLPPIEVK